MACRGPEGAGGEKRPAHRLLGLDHALLALAHVLGPLRDIVDAIALLAARIDPMDSSVLRFGEALAHKSGAYGQKPRDSGALVVVTARRATGQRAPLFVAPRDPRRAREPLRAGAGHALEQGRLVLGAHGLDLGRGHWRPVCRLRAFLCRAKAARDELHQLQAADHGSARIWPTSPSISGREDLWGDVGASTSPRCAWTGCTGPGCV